MLLRVDSGLQQEFTAIRPNLHRSVPCGPTLHILQVDTAHYAESPHASCKLDQGNTSIFAQPRPECIVCGSCGAPLVGHVGLRLELLRSIWSALAEDGAVISSCVWPVEGPRAPCSSVFLRCGVVPKATAALLSL